jgi:hypothetical protein
LPWAVDAHRRANRRPNRRQPVTPLTCPGSGQAPPGSPRGDPGDGSGSGGSTGEPTRASTGETTVAVPAVAAPRGEPTAAPPGDGTDVSDLVSGRQHGVPAPVALRVLNRPGPRQPRPDGDRHLVRRRQDELRELIRLLNRYPWSP